MCQWMSETDTFDTGLAKATHKSAARLVEVNWFNSRYVALMCVYSSVCKLVLHEPLNMTLKRCLLCLTTSRSDTLWPGNKVKYSYYFLAVLKMQRHMPSGIGLFHNLQEMVSDMILVWKKGFSFPMAHVFTCKTLSCPMCISGLCLSVFCAACYSEKALFTSESSIFILKAIFFFCKLTISDQKWMKPVIFDEETISMQVNTSSYECLLWPFSISLPSLLFLIDICLVLSNTMLQGFSKVGILALSSCAVSSVFLCM